MSLESVKVSIFGDEYSIKSDVEVETTKKIAEYIDQKMTELHKGNPSRDKMKIAILSALTIAGELFEYKETAGKEQQFGQECRTCIERINQKINEVMA